MRRGTATANSPKSAAEEGMLDTGPPSSRAEVRVSTTRSSSAMRERASDIMPSQASCDCRQHATSSRMEPPYAPAYDSQSTAAPGSTIRKAPSHIMVW